MDPSRVERPGVRMAELTPGIAIDAGRIPSTTLPDPFDRLLIATARSLGVGLLTRDRRILDYADQTGQLQAVDAGTQVPGVFVILGVTPPAQVAKAAANHSPKFFVDESALVTGVRALANLAADYLFMPPRS